MFIDLVIYKYLLPSDVKLISVQVCHVYKPVYSAVRFISRLSPLTQYHFPFLPLYSPLSVPVERSSNLVFDSVGLAGFKSRANSILLA